MKNDILSLPLKNFISIEDLSHFVKDYKSIIEKKLDTPIKEFSFYKNYLKKFDLKEFYEYLILPNTPKDIMDLILKLLFGSFALDYKFEIQNNKVRINILFLRNNESVFLDELIIFEIGLILSNLLSEQLEYEILAENKGEFERKMLENLKKEKLNKFYKEKNRVLKKLGIN